MSDQQTVKFYFRKTEGGKEVKEEDGWLNQIGTWLMLIAYSGYQNDLV